MTKAEVLIIVDQPNGQRFVCGSDIILDKYNKGTLRPTETDKKYDGAIQRPLWRVMSLVFCRLVTRQIKSTLMKASLVFWDMKELLFQ